MKYRFAPLLVAVSLLAAGTRAGAEPTGPDRNLAQSLFEQAKGLMAAGKYEEACPKLAESQRLDPGGGTLLNLALCHEREGKTASAWSDFKEALSVARRDGRAERVRDAEEHIAALEPKLPWLTVTITAAVEGEVASLDGASLGKAAWGSPVAIDPGMHELHAEAPGRKPWKAAVQMAAGERKAVAVPALEAAEGEPAHVPAANVATLAPAPSQSPVTSSPETGNRTLGFIVGGAGVAALGVGTFFGVRAISKRHDSDSLCPTDTTCSPQGVELNNEATTAAWISNIGIGSGLVAVAVGTWLILRSSPGTESKATAASPLSVGGNVGATGGELHIEGRW